MAPSADDLLEALRRVPYPGFTRDIVAAGVVVEARLDHGVARVRLETGGAPAAVVQAIEAAVGQALRELEGVDSVDVQPGGAPAPPAGLRMAAQRPSAARAGGLDAALIPEVRHTIAVASGKGGVGKSTVAVNLAVALAQSGASVGLLDADIYGPSVPIMTGVTESPRLTEERLLIPFERHGIKLMSLGFLVDPGSAVIWRGPMVMKAIEQLLRDVVWGRLDILVVDMPPGTGDAQLTLAQRVQLAGAVIVTTPQDVALADAIKGVAMFRKVGVEVLGFVENMSHFACPHCGTRTSIFGSGGGRREAARLGVPLLGEIPLDPEIRVGGDEGEPIVARHPESPQSAAFHAIARTLLERLGVGVGQRQARPSGLFERFRKSWGGSGE